MNKSNAISANHNYSKLHAPSADVNWSGRFFCLVEKNGVDDAPRFYHVDVEVAKKASPYPPLEGKEKLSSGRIALPPPPPP